jgi:hypothetical protein
MPEALDSAIRQTLPGHADEPSAGGNDRKPHGLGPDPEKPATLAYAFLAAGANTDHHEVENVKPTKRPI